MNAVSEAGAAEIITNPYRSFIGIGNNSPLWLKGFLSMVYSALECVYSLAAIHAENLAVLCPPAKTWTFSLRRGTNGDRSAQKALFIAKKASQYIEKSFCSWI